MIEVAIIGFGVVGSGVIEVINKNNESIKKRAGERISVKKILDIMNFDDSIYKNLLTKNPNEVFDDDDIKIVIETIGGIGIAYEYTKRALLKGKSVVTSNKELVATYGPELMQMAKDNNVHYFYEASVGGGIPIIRPLNQCLAANEIDKIMGILNGTTNYILSKMKNENMSFDNALKEAKEKGYAEADPTADIEGHDACRKIAILSSIAFGEFVDYNEIYTEGITKITSKDIEIVRSMNSVIKLIAKSERKNGKISVMVSPLIIDNDHSLSHVEDVFNAIEVQGDAIGTAMFYGRGAGKLPTASAVVADIIDIVKNQERKYTEIWKRSKKNNLLKFEDSSSKFLIRVKVRNPDEAKGYINEKFNKPKYIILDNKESKDELIYITKSILESDIKMKIKDMNNIASIKSVDSIIRYEGKL